MLCKFTLSIKQALSSYTKKYWIPFWGLFKNTSCQKGASLVEFALVFPLMIMIIFATVELGIMLAIRVNLQSCVMTGSYYGSLGNYTTGSTRLASAQAAMTNTISRFLKPANLTITIQSFPTFAAASTGAGGSVGTGNPSQVGMYQAQYRYVPSCPLVAAIYGTAKVLTATTYTKNEGTFPS